MYFNTQLTVLETLAFSNWLAVLWYVKGRAKIVARIERIRVLNHFGESVGGGVSELRVHFGPGYRV